MKKTYQPLVDYLKSRRLILVLSLLYTLIVGLVVLNRFWQFESFYYDQGLFERAIWLVSRFQTPIIDHQTLGRVHHFADHFVPSLYILFSPWYWFTQRYDITLIALTIYTGLSVLVAYEIAKLKVKNKVIIYALLIAYMGYVGLQNALIFFIHDTTAMLLPLMLLFLTLFKEKWKFFYVLLLLNFGFKESNAVVGLGIAAFMWFYNKKWRRHSLVVAFSSIGYGYLTSKVIIPYYSDNRFLYTPTWPTSIQQFFQRLVDTPTKVQVVLYSLMTFGFLPLLAPAIFFLLFQDIVLRFVLSYVANSQRWDLGLHYNANLAVFLFIGAILGVAFLESKLKFPKKILSIYGVIVVLVVLYLHQFKFHGPFGLAYNKDFYKHTSRQGFMHEFINRIPTEGKIMTQNNIAVFFTHHDLYLLDGYEYFKEIGPDTIAVDLRPGQNPNNFWPMDEKGMTELVEKLKKETKYNLEYDDGSRFIFRLSTSL